MITFILVLVYYFHSLSLPSLLIKNQKSQAGETYNTSQVMTTKIIKKIKTLFLTFGISLQPSTISTEVGPSKEHDKVIWSI